MDLSPSSSTPENGGSEQHDHLPRLPRSAYRGKAIIHWSLTIAQRQRGWLDARFHQAFRWNLLHGCCRYAVACPLYCLMPDHIHLLVAGWALHADQLLFMRFLRRHLTPVLQEAGAWWQKQPYDHVLRDRERERGSFETVAWYIAGNPVRAQLVRVTAEWPFTSCVIPGYPELQPHLEDYWTRYWRIIASRTDAEAQERSA